MTQDYAAKEFQKVAEAYEVLSDDEMRKIYDQGGSLEEACCKRKYQQSNEVGEDDEETEESMFRYELYLRKYVDFLSRKWIFKYHPILFLKLDLI